MEYKTSIVIPVFNKPELLDNLLTGLLHEKNQIDEVLIMDNASTDNMQELYTRWVDGNELPVRVILNKENIGFTLNANKGLK